jgi:hypothetical protein
MRIMIISSRIGLHLCVQRLFPHLSEVSLRLLRMALFGTIWHGFRGPSSPILISIKDLWKFPGFNGTLAADHSMNGRICILNTELIPSSARRFLSNVAFRSAKGFSFAERKTTYCCRLSGAFHRVVDRATKWRFLALSGAFWRFLALFGKALSPIPNLRNNL